MDNNKRLFVSMRARMAAVFVLLAAVLPCGAMDLYVVPYVAMDDSVGNIEKDAYPELNDSVAKIVSAVDSASLDNVGKVDSVIVERKKEKRDWSTWRPSAKRAMWLAIVIPGAGQIYNRKYWKLPIVYGGFVGCFYAIRWNNQMFRDYSQAYMDIMDNDPNTQSYNQFLHLGVTITPENTEHYQDLFRRRKDFYRRYRDLSVFILVGVYALSVIDAYVDASLSEFDISPDLSLKIEPAVLNNGTSMNPLKSSSLGFQCLFTF